MSYTSFIKENKAPLGTTKIGVYNNSGNRVGKIDLTNTFKTPSDLGEKLYSFGVISDIHIPNTDFAKKFINALKYFNANVDFICVSGDLTANGNQNEFEQVKNQIDTYATVPIYLTSGNHDCYNYGANGAVETALDTYFNTKLYYAITKNNDIFIFVGEKTNSRGSIFTHEELQWLYDTLEENRNKRCFLIQHSFVESNGSGDANNLYGGTMLTGNELTIIKSLVSHYQNIIHFHGHSHLIYELQEIDDNKDCNYSDKYGSKEFHVPSLQQPRTINTSYTGTGLKYTNYNGSEGYVVDVYSKYIIVKGRDFSNNKFLPIAYYCLDTSLKTINAYTYTDSTGIIDTSSTYSITNNLSNAITNNSATSVTKKTSYSATITPSTNYNIQSITVTMGGLDITSSCVTDNTISIASVTGDIIITVTTVAILKTYSITNNLSNATNSNTNTEIQEKTSYNATISVSSNEYVIDSVMVTMGGNDITSTSYSNGVINIPSVTGNIVITVTTKYFSPTYTFNWNNTSENKLCMTSGTPISKMFIPSSSNPNKGETNKGYFTNCLMFIELNKTNFAIKAKINANNYHFTFGIYESDTSYRGLSSFGGTTIANNSKGNNTYSVPRADFLNKDHTVEIMCNKGSYSIIIDGVRYACDTWVETPKYGKIQPNMAYYGTTNGIGSSNDTAITPDVIYPSISISSDTSYLYIKELSFVEWD